MPCRYQWRSALGGASNSDCMCFRLPPDENTGPAPVTTTQRTDMSAAMRAHASTNSCGALLPVSALRVSAASIVSVTILPDCS
jgi:hypothetical protein